MNPDPGSPMKGPLVVIPCLNEARHIGAILEDLFKDPAATELLVIVVDGGSSDGSCAIVEALARTHSQLRLMHNPARIQSAGVNAAVRQFAENRVWLVRMDAHAEYPARFASSIVMTAIEQSAQSVVVPMRAVTARGPDRSCFQKAVVTAQNSRLGTGGAAHRMGAVSHWVDHGHHALMRIDAFTAVGGYDEQLATNEDFDLDLRLAARGTRIWLSVEHEIGYFPRTTARALWLQYVRFGAGRAATFSKHRNRPKLRQWLPIFLAPAVASMALGPWIPLLLAPAGIWAATCLIYGLVLGIRSRSLCAVASGPAAMVMHFAWSAGFWARMARWHR